MAQVDLATRIIPRDHQVFVLHPGDAKRFYEATFSSSMVFLDLPGIVFDRPINVEDPILLRKLVLAHEVRAWRINGSNEEAEPSRDLAAYAKNKKTNGLAQHLHYIEALYKGAKPGDVVVVPGAGYMSNVLIGEIIGEYSVDDRVGVERYNEDLVPGRRVKWLSTSRPKGRYSARLIKYMQNNNAIIALKEPNLILEVYREAYRNFVLPNYAESRVRIQNEVIDLRKFTTSSEVIIYAAAIYSAAVKGESERALAMSPALAIVEYYDGSHLLDTGISINSPGYIALKAKELGLPLFVGAMLALGAAGMTLDEARASEIVNSSSTQASPCEIEAEEQLRLTLGAMGYEGWRIWCTMAQGANRDVGMKAHPQVRRGLESVLTVGGEGSQNE